MKDTTSTTPFSAGLATELRRQSGDIAGVALFSSVANLLLLVVPIYSMQVYDRVLSSGSTETLAMLTLAAVGGLLFYGLLDAIRSRLLMRLGARLENDLSCRLLAHEIRQSERGRPGTGAALKDLKEVSGYIGSVNFAALLDIPWAPIFTLLMFVIHPTLGVISILASLVLIAIGLISDRWTSKSTEKARGSAAIMNRASEEFLRNAELLRAMGVARHAIDRWNVFNGKAIEYYMTSGDRIALLTASARVLRQGIQVAITGFGILLVLHQDLTVGVVFAASMLLGRALGPLESSISAFKAFSGAREAWHRLDAVLRDMSERDMATKVELPEPRGAFKLSGMTVRVEGRDQPILDGVSFELAAGEVLGVIGSSGSGKSTLMRHLTGITMPTEGSIRLDGAEMKEWPEEQLGRNVGYLPQEVELLTGTVADNIACLDPNMTSQAVITAARAAHLHDIILKLPKGYNTPVGPHGALLSAGQRQRIGLARAFYGNRKILILDEPNAHLDADGERQLSLSVQDAKKRGCTVIIATHRMQILNVVDRIAMFENGTLIKYGASRDVIAWVQNRNGQAVATSAATAAPQPTAAKPTPPAPQAVAATKVQEDATRTVEPVGVLHRPPIA